MEEPLGRQAQRADHPAALVGKALLCPTYQLEERLGADRHDPGEVGVGHVQRFGVGEDERIVDQNIETAALLNRLYHRLSTTSLRQVALR